MNKTNNPYYSLFHAIKSFYTIRQKEEENVEDYYRHFETAQELVVLSNGAITKADKLLTIEQRTDQQADETSTLQKFLAIAFIEQADSNRFKNL